MATKDKLVSLEDLKAAFDVTVHTQAQTLGVAVQTQARDNVKAEERQATKIIPADGGYVSANSTATTVAVDSEGVPTTTGSEASYKHHFAACAPGDFVTVKTGSVGTNLRPCLFLGAAADGVRPILSKPVSSSKLAVFRAPENAEMVVFQSGTSALTNLNWFYIGAKLDVALADIYSRFDTVDAALVELAALIEG